MTTMSERKLGPLVNMGLCGHHQGAEGEFYDIAFMNETTRFDVGRVYVRNQNEYARGRAKQFADLFVAAPQLLAALKYIELSTRPDGQWADRAVCFFARAAIALAEGATP